MQDKVKAAKVGALVIAAAVASFVVWRMVDERSQTGEGYHVCANFENAHGLITKSRVTVAGISVGYIDRIALDGANAQIDIVLQNDVQLQEDWSVTRRSASLLGEFILAIDPGSSETAANRDTCIQAQSSADTSDLIANLGRASESIVNIVEEIERILVEQEGGREIEEALRALNEALQTVNATVQANADSVTNTLHAVERITYRAEPRLEEILANVEQVTSDVRVIVENNRDGLDEGVGEVGPTIASINRAAQQLERVLEDVGEVTERTAAGEGTIGRLTADEHLIDEVEETIEGVNSFVGGLTRLRTIVGLRSEYLFLTNAFRNTIEIRIAPAEDRYFLIQLVDDPRGQTQFTSTTVRTSPPRRDEPATYQEVRATTTESLLFSLQLAKRLYFMTLRFGILESSGGIGLDFHFLDDHLEINADLFRFGDQVFPNLRVRFAYEIVQTLFIMGGVDNILNIDPNVPTQNGADFFLGAMLRFDDRDLVGLLPFLGGAAGAIN